MHLPTNAIITALAIISFVVGSGMSSGGVQAGEPLDGRGLAPYRFNPPPEPLSPSEEAAAQAYRQRLQGMTTEIERQKLRETPLGQEQLRRTQRELNRMDRMLDIR